MSSKRHSAGYWVHTWWPVALALCVIAFESTEFMGTRGTSGPLRWLWTHLFSPVSDASWDQIHHYTRKAGHFLGYGFVGLTWLRAWWRTLYHSRFFVDAALALTATAAVASADEFHQSFLSGRSSSPWDVLIDCAGSLFLQLCVYLFWRICTPKRLLHED